MNARTAGKYRFELKYFENRARWLPVYEVRADGEGPLEMKLRADIRQSTGEDWKGVELSLLTGNPSAAGSVPQLTPVLLDIRQPVEFARNTMMLKSAGARAMVMGDAVADTCEEAPMMAMGTNEAFVDQSETSTEYVLPGTRDVQKNGKETVADIQTYEIPADYRIVAVPKLDQSAYLVAAVKPADLPVNSAIDTAVYLNNAYTGRIMLDPHLT